MPRKNSNQPTKSLSALLAYKTARVIRALDRIIEWRGPPCTIRCDSGRKYVSDLLATWAEKRGIGLLFIQPGKPQQNAYVERYNQTVMDDWLNQYLLKTIGQVQEAATAPKKGDITSPPHHPSFDTPHAHHALHTPAQIQIIVGYLGDAYFASCRLIELLILRRNAPRVHYENHNVACNAFRWAGFKKPGQDYQPVAQTIPTSFVHSEQNTAVSRTQRAVSEAKRHTECIKFIDGRMGARKGDTCLHRLLSMMRCSQTGDTKIQAKITRRL